jgi:hypothetical protein
LLVWVVVGMMGMTGSGRKIRRETITLLLPDLVTAHNNNRKPE